MVLALENFSAEYILAPEVEVNAYDGDSAQMDAELYAVLREILGEPIVGMTGGLHYHFEPSTEVLVDRCAVPKSNHDPTADLTLLLAK